MLRHTTKRLLSQSLWCLLGRRNLVRVARFLGNEARLDLPNNISTNGERMVQERICRIFQGKRLCVFDVGANVGNWADSLLVLAKAYNRDVTIHAFEPARASYAQFARRHRQQEPNRSVLCRNIALSSRTGVQRFYVTAPDAGINSLYPTNIGAPQAVEQVETSTLDDYCREERISHIHFLKIDTEGHDLEVLYGAQSRLQNGAVDIVQFEYNWRWIEAKHFLREAFDFVLPLGYRIGKVTPYGLELYPRWHFELETFREGNYLALRDELVNAFPQIKWWNA